MGIAMSDSPQRVDDAHAHRADSRQQATCGSDKESEEKPKNESRLRQNKLWQQASERHAESGNGPRGKKKTKNSTSQSDGDRLGENQEKNRTIRKSNGLQDCEFAGAFPNGDGHGVASNKEKGKENHAADRQDKKLDVPKLFRETSSKRRFGHGFGFTRRVGKLLVNGLGNTDGLVGTIELEDVPADLALDEGRHAFVEVFPLKPELAFIAAWFVAVINAIEIEIPIAVGAVKRVLDGDAVANLPAKTLCGSRANNRSLAVLDEVLPLVLGHDEFAHHLTVVFDVDGKLRKEIFLFDVHAAEPVVVGDGLHARNG